MSIVYNSFVSLKFYSTKVHKNLNIYNTLLLLLNYSNFFVKKKAVIALVECAKQLKIFIYDNTISKSWNSEAAR